MTSVQVDVTVNLLSHCLQILEFCKFSVSPTVAYHSRTTNPDDHIVITNWLERNIHRSRNEVSCQVVILSWAGHVVLN